MQMTNFIPLYANIKPHVGTERFLNLDGNCATIKIAVQLRSFISRITVNNTTT